MKVEPLEPQIAHMLRTGEISDMIDLKDLHQRSGSYQVLFSRRAKLFHERQLGAEDLDESRYKELLLEHYTFLKRPVLIWEDDIYIGSSKATIEQAYKTLHKGDWFWSV